MEYYDNKSEENLLKLSSVIENAPYVITRQYDQVIAGGSKGSSSSSSHSGNSSSSSASKGTTIDSKL